MMTMSAEVVFIYVIGFLSVVSVDARLHFFRETEMQAKNISEDCSECGITIQKQLRLIIKDTSVNKSSDYPWMVSLRADKDSNICSGAIIDKYYILTAAHCFENDPEKLKVYFQTQDLKEMSSGYAIEQVVKHPQFSRNDSGMDEVGFTQHDIALVKLKEEIKCDEYKNPICLPDAGFKLSRGDESIIAGWGSTDGTGSFQSEELQNGRIKNLDIDECIKAVPRTEEIKDLLLCQGGTNTSPCYGDSGAPLMHEIKQKYYVVGITAFSTINGCSTDRPVIYTNVVKYLDWIKENKNASLL